MEKIVARTFKDTTVNLDFSEYEKCSFVKCVIHSDYGIFDLVDCDFSECKLDLGNPAKNVAALIKLFYPDMPVWFERVETKEQVLEKMKERLVKEGLI